MLLKTQHVSWTVAVVLMAALLLGNFMPSDDSFRKSDLKELAKDLTVVITGANSGLGYGTVEHLARLGTAKTVVLACRSRIKCQSAKENASKVLPLESTTQLFTIEISPAGPPLRGLPMNFQNCWPLETEPSTISPQVERLLMSSLTMQVYSPLR